MATASTTLTVVVFFALNLLETVYGYYCDNDKCLEEEFCCGENICCVSYKVWELWYFWCGILFCLLLLSLCGCFWRQRSRAYWVFRAPISYSSLPVEEDAKFSPGHCDPYLDKKERALNVGSFYGPSKQQMAWYDEHVDAKIAGQPYTDAEKFYDSGVKKKAEY